MCINQFVWGLPNIPAFNSLRSDLPTRVTDAKDDDFGAFIALTEKALELDTIFRSILSASTSTSTRAPRPHTVPAPPIASSLPPNIATPAVPPTAVGNTPYPTKLCTNCGRKGHLAEMSCLG
jgi:hypothetical protein